MREEIGKAIQFIIGTIKRNCIRHYLKESCEEFSDRFRTILFKLLEFRYEKHWYELDADCGQAFYSSINCVGANIVEESVRSHITTIQRELLHNRMAYRITGNFNGLEMEDRKERDDLVYLHNFRNVIVLITRLVNLIHYDEFKVTKIIYESFGHEMTIWIDPNEVAYRLGGETVITFFKKEGNVVVHDLAKKTNDDGIVVSTPSETGTPYENVKYSFPNTILAQYPTMINEMIGGQITYNGNYQPMESAFYPQLNICPPHFPTFSNNNTQLPQMTNGNRTNIFYRSDIDQFNRQFSLPISSVDSFQTTTVDSTIIPMNAPTSVMHHTNILPQKNESIHHRNHIQPHPNQRQQHHHNHHHQFLSSSMNDILMDRISFFHDPHLSSVVNNRSDAPPTVLSTPPVQLQSQQPFPNILSHGTLHPIQTHQFSQSIIHPNSITTSHLVTFDDKLKNENPMKYHVSDRMSQSYGRTENVSINRQDNESSNLPTMRSYQSQFPVYQPSVEMLQNQMENLELNASTSNISRMVSNGTISNLNTDSPLNLEEHNLSMKSRPVRPDRFYPQQLTEMNTMTPWNDGAMIGPSKEERQLTTNVPVNKLFVNTTTFSMNNFNQLQLYRQSNPSSLPVQNHQNYHVQEEPKLPTNSIQQSQNYRPNSQLTNRSEQQTNQSQQFSQFHPPQHFPSFHHQPPQQLNGQHHHPNQQLNGQLTNQHANSPSISSLSSLTGNERSEWNGVNSSNDVMTERHEQQELAKARRFRNNVQSNSCCMSNEQQRQQQHAILAELKASSSSTKITGELLASVHRDIDDVSVSLSEVKQRQYLHMNSRERRQTLDVTDLIGEIDEYSDTPVHHPTVDVTRQSIDNISTISATKSMYDLPKHNGKLSQKKSLKFETEQSKDDRLKRVKQLKSSSRIHTNSKSSTTSSVGNITADGESCSDKKSSKKPVCRYVESYPFYYKLNAINAQVKQQHKVNQEKSTNSSQTAVNGGPSSSSSSTVASDGRHRCNTNNSTSNSIKSDKSNRYSISEKENIKDVKYVRKNNTKKIISNQKPLIEKSSILNHNNSYTSSIVPTTPTTFTTPTTTTTTQTITLTATITTTTTTTATTTNTISQMCNSSRIVTNFRTATTTVISGSGGDKTNGMNNEPVSLVNKKSRMTKEMKQPNVEVKEKKHSKDDDYISRHSTSLETCNITRNLFSSSAERLNSPSDNIGVQMLLQLASLGMKHIPSSHSLQCESYCQLVGNSKKSSHSHKMIDGSNSLLSKPFHVTINQNIFINRNE
ncbi:hypothetical protein SNEBB_004436 [Seison nebaliae]|nr:hypothetical protein SNEBB_004436 [Seison nebaliae]